MSRAALTLAVAAALALATAGRAGAHLVASGSETLLGMMASADGMVVARVVEATHARDDKSAATPFLARQTVAGIGPEDAFVLDAEPPILRYAETQDVLVLLARRPVGRDAVRWVSVQPAGAAIVLQSPTLPESSRVVLQALWSVAQPASGGSGDPAVAVDALIDALALPEQKLRALAYRDLAALASDPEHFSPAARARLASYGDQPGDDAQLAPAVRDVGWRLQQSGPPAPKTTAAGDAR
jgi:hypothetical protein